MAKTQVQYGSQGSDVKELQELLNTHGYNLDVDGIFGDKTKYALIDYQEENNLMADGIAGTQTWTSLLGNSSTTNTSTTNTSTPVAAPTLGANPTLPTYDTSSYDDSTKGSAAWDTYQGALGDLNAHGDFKYGNQKQLNEIINSILNREKFTYDLNGDALYQQYKDKFTQQAHMAMADSIGQASAMTGGYGNSYAQSVGQQMYQKEMQNLNDIVPELYQMALDKYNAEGQELYNQYGLLSDDRAYEYGQFTDKYGRLMDKVNIARGDYYDGADIFHAEQTNKNNVADKEFSNAMDILNRDDENAWKQATWDEDARRYAEEMAYQKERDKVADQQWQKEYDAQYGNTAVDNKTKHYSGTKADGSSYDNGSLTTSQVKALQSALGVTADGYYGEQSKKAAGGLSAAEAYAKFVDGSVDNTGGTTVDPNSKAITDFKSKLSPSSTHDAIARQMYGPYNAYVAVEIANSSLSNEEKKYLIQYYGITETDINYARDKGWNI